MWYLGGSFFWGVGRTLVWTMIMTFFLGAVGLIDIERTAPKDFSMEHDVSGITIHRFDADREAEQSANVSRDVMGGVPESPMRFTEQGAALFTSVLSLQNNDGFASVRMYPHRYELGGYEGPAIHIQDDGRHCKLRVGTDDRWDGVAYSADFATAE